MIPLPPAFPAPPPPAAPALPLPPTPALPPAPPGPFAQVPPPPAFESEIWGPGVAAFVQEARRSTGTELFFLSLFQKRGAQVGKGMQREVPYALCPMLL